MVEVAETTNKTPGKYSVPGLDKGLDVLELLSDRAASMSQVEIARALGKSTSEIFRTLSALEARTYIRRTEAGQYRLTLKLFELSRMHSPYEEMMRVALPIMRRLSEEIGETCHLTTLRDGEIVVLAQHESPKPLRLSVEVGSKHSPIATTSGRIILSAMTAEDRKAFLTDYTSFDELPDDVKTTFLNRVNNVVERGYEIAEGEKFVGGLDVGVLVGTEKSTVRAALIVATLRNADGPDTDRLLSAVQEAGAELTERIGLGD
ncbi:MAG: IclR family transcriptional regulator [Roseibium sp.]